MAIVLLDQTHEGTRFGVKLKIWEMSRREISLQDYGVWNSSTDSWEWITLKSGGTFGHIQHRHHTFPSLSSSLHFVLCRSRLLRRLYRVERYNQLRRVNGHAIADGGPCLDEVSRLDGTRPDPGVRRGIPAHRSPDLLADSSKWFHLGRKEKCTPYASLVSQIPALPFVCLRAMPCSDPEVVFFAGIVRTQMSDPNTRLLILNGPHPHLFENVFHCCVLFTTGGFREFCESYPIMCASKLFPTHPGLCE